LANEILPRVRIVLSPQLTSDEEIIARVQRGRTSEYLILFDRYYARVENYARRHLQHTEAARDVASETFLRAYRNVQRFRIGEGITYLGYLLMICRRLILTEHAQQRRAHLVSLEDSPEAERLSDTACLPLAQLLEGERQQMIQGALDHLPDDDREIIYLAFERDLSRRDIAEILGKPSVSAVTSHLYRAMQKLKRVVTAQGYFTVEDEYETDRRQHNISP
jgi:RNA polymerase sigma-70 factor, ECF subfamily